MIRQLLSDFAWLLYPKLCAACDRPLNAGEECICTYCRFHLPRTHFHREPGNPVEKNFWGRVPVVAATAFFHFSKGEKVQHMIHHLKYKGQKEVGIFTGIWMGNEVKSSPGFSDVDVIIPVPLHAKRQRKRGYNQSTMLAEGLSRSLGRPCSETLYRNANTSTQTRKHRYERYENVNKGFLVKEPSSLEYKHILLVDDVITTGATLIACAETILEIPGTRLSIAAMAYA